MPTLEELKEYFTSNTYPKEYRLSSGEYIADTKVFVEKALFVLEHMKNKPQRQTQTTLPDFKRLVKFYNYCKTLEK